MKSHAPIYAALLSVAVTAFTAQPTLASFVALFCINPVVLAVVILAARHEGRMSAE